MTENTKMSADHEENEPNNLSKSSKKALRKQKRAHYRLLRDMNVESSEKPTQNLAICNAGLVTGLAREVLENIVQKETSNYVLSMPPGKSYSFLKFNNIEEASNFYDSVHGKVLVPDQNTYFYLLYIESVPNSEHDLFNSEYPEGLRVIENFITPEQESILLNSINWNDNVDSHVETDSILKHRKVKHFGYEFRYDNNKVDIDKPIEPIPDSYQFLHNLFKENDCGQFDYDQLTINRYLPGQGIPSHIDTHSVFEDTILSLSMGSPCIMNFKRHEKRFSLDLQPCSLLIMSKKARYGWAHGICPRHNDCIWKNNGFTTRPRSIRISFTFRKVRKSCTCDCDELEFCDNNSKISTNSSLDTSAALNLENVYVHSVYNEISGHFNETRHKQWPNVTKFIESVHNGSLLVDVGCGNGKYLSGSPQIYKIGCDRSKGLADICHKKGFQTVLADCLSLPFRCGSLDAVICIAVIHHLSTEERRRQAIDEIMRILNKNGRALIYVWAKEQDKDSNKSAYLKFNTCKNKDAMLKAEGKLCKVDDNVVLPVHENRTAFKHRDMLVPWKLKGGQEFLRYYHVFEYGELEKLCAQVNSTEIEKSYYDEGNWCIILRKK